MLIHEMLLYLIDEYDLDENYLWETRQEAIKSCVHATPEEAKYIGEFIEKIPRDAFGELERRLNHKMRFYSMLTLLVALEKQIDSYDEDKATSKETEEITKLTKALFKFDSVIDKFDSQFESGFYYDETKEKVRDKLNLVRQKLCAIRFEKALEEKSYQLKTLPLSEYSEWYDRLYWRYHREDDDLFYDDPDKKENFLFNAWCQYHPEPELSERNYNSVVQYYTWKLKEWQAKEYLIRGREIFSSFDPIRELEKEIKERARDETMISAAERFINELTERLNYWGFLAYGN